MESLEKYYTLLGLQPDAELSEVEEAYKKRVEMYKSEYYSDDPDFARERIKELENAYKAIKSDLGKDWVAVGKSYLDAVRKREEDIENGLIELTPYQAMLREEEKRDKKKAAGFFIFLIAIIFIIGILPYDIPEEFDPKNYVYITDYPDALPRDIYIAEVASEAKEFIEEYAIEHPRESVEIDTSDSVYSTQADIIKKFVRTYWVKWSDFYDVTKYLVANYDGYTCDNSYYLHYYDNAIYAFYGFMNMEEIGGYRNPYNNKMIETWDDMMKYYTKFYKQYSKRFPYKGKIYTGAGKQD